MSHPLFRRKKKIINPHYQLKAALTCAISILVYSFVLGFIIFYPLSRELYSASTMEDKARVSEIVLSLHKQIWPAVFLVSGLLFLHVILASHRVAGPIYRLEKTMEEFLKGNFSVRMKLRTSDRFREIEDTVNRLAEYLESSKSADGRFHADLKTRLDSARAALQIGGHTGQPAVLDGATNVAGRDEALSILSGLVTELDMQRDAFSAGTGKDINKGV